jgi:hypothetical protein
MIKLQKILKNKQYISNGNDHRKCVKEFSWIYHTKRVYGILGMKVFRVQNLGFILG